MRKLTSDQAEIRRWAAQRQAHPVERAPYFRDGEVAQLDFVFGDVPQAEEHLQPIEWSRFFAIFELMGLVLAYDDDRQFELLRTDGPYAGEANGGPAVA